LSRANGRRAVENALVRNPFPVIVPCHRAIGSDRHLGGFQGDPARKQALLEREGSVSRDAGRMICKRFQYGRKALDKCMGEKFSFIILSGIPWRNYSSQSKMGYFPG
jgi:hypothetical protein